MSRAVEAKKAADLLWHEAERVREFVLAYVRPRRPEVIPRLRFTTHVGAVDRLQQGPGRFIIQVQVEPGPGQSDLGPIPAPNGGPGWVRQVPPQFIVMDGDLDGLGKPEVTDAIDQVLALS